MGGCTLARWSGLADRCRWCDALFGSDGPLPVGASAFGRDDPGGWCSVACADEHHRNHWWDLARLSALARDDARCVECGRGPASVSEGKLFLRALIPMGPVDAARLWASRPWQRFSLDCRVEVHHLTPRLGAGYGSGCHHHLEGLVTLCHAHHASVTAAAGRDARAG